MDTANAAHALRKIASGVTSPRAEPEATRSNDRGGRGGRLIRVGSMGSASPFTMLMRSSGCGGGSRRLEQIELGFCTRDQRCGQRCVVKRRAESLAIVECPAKEAHECTALLARGHVAVDQR